VDQGRMSELLATVGSSASLRRSQTAGKFLLGVAVVAGVLGAYWYYVFLGLENPLTSVLPQSTYATSYAQNYFQTASDYQLCGELSIAALGLSALFFSFNSIKDLPLFRPLHAVHSYLQHRSSTFKTMTLVVPLALLETGLLLYGGLMGVARYNFDFSLELRQQPIVQDLVLGPFASSGGSYASGQDYYFLVIFAWVLLASYYRLASIRRVLQIGALAIIPLPLLIYLFDGVEFNTFFAAGVDRAGLPWFSNAVLLYLSVAILAAATVYPTLMRRIPKSRSMANG